MSRGAEAVLHTLGVYLFEFVDEHVIDAIVVVLIARLTARKLRGQRPRRAVIYGPNKKVIRDFELPTTETDQQDDQKGERKMWTVRTMGQGQDQKVNIVFETAAGSLDLSVSEALQFAAQILHAAKDITQAQSKQAT